MAETTLSPVETPLVEFSPLIEVQESQVVLSPVDQQDVYPVAPLDAPDPQIQPDEDELELELGDELIIEDFTIDGICGVY